MDLNSLIPSSDNLYKYLFIGGIFLCVFSILYPLEKKQELEVLINDHNKEIELLNQEINKLHKRVSELQITSKELILILNRLQSKNTNQKVNKLKIKQIEAEFEKQYLTLESEQYATSKKNIIQNYNKKKIIILQKQIESFIIFQISFLIIGFLCFTFGLVNWYKLTVRFEKLQKNELLK